MTNLKSSLRVARIGSRSIRPRPGRCLPVFFRMVGVKEEEKRPILDIIPLSLPETGPRKLHPKLHFTLRFRSTTWRRARLLLLHVLHWTSNRLLTYTYKIVVRFTTAIYTTSSLTAVQNVQHSTSIERSGSTDSISMGRRGVPTDTTGCHQHPHRPDGLRYSKYPKAKNHQLVVFRSSKR